jgi:hypothetical protein
VSKPADPVTSENPAANPFGSADSAGSL